MWAINDILSMAERLVWKWRRNKYNESNEETQ